MYAHPNMMFPKTLTAIIDLGVLSCIVKPATLMLAGTIISHFSISPIGLKIECKFE